MLLTIAKLQMLNKPYIHYIDVKVMNNVSRKLKKWRFFPPPGPTSHVTGVGSWRVPCGSLAGHFGGSPRGGEGRPAVSTRHLGGGGGGLFG